ncbi:MAG TPA: helix-turn-helix domain-containing protein [Kribbella sp.]|nr:helix-turn-helix domain-containing protein [Kribbella sp.]
MAAPARRDRRSSWITAKAGARTQQTPVQPTQPYVPGSPEWLTTPGTYTTSRRRKKAGHAVVPAAPPQLPQLGPAATAVPGLVPSPGAALVPVQPAGLPAKRPGDQATEAFTAARRMAWRYRWQLTPAVVSAGTAIGAGAVSPVLTVLGLGALAGAGYLTASKGPEELGGRVWLSRAERAIVGRWAAGAGVWSAGLGVANAAGMHWTVAGVLVAAGALGVLTGTPVLAWLKSRQIRDADVVDGDAKPRSDAALQLIAAWPTAVALNGPDKLKGSAIVDLDEPDPGTIVARVQLRADVHAEDVATADTRKWLERSLHMGVGTAKVTTVRDNAGHVELVLTPSRQLEKVTKLWTGPRLYEDGRAPVAITTAGREVCIRLFDESGVRHVILIGSSNAGKSNAANVILLPLVLSGRSVMFHADGKRGTSSPELAQVMDLAGHEPDEWRRAIRVAHRVLVAREKRYGRMGLSKFDMNGEDPVLELVLDEGRTIQEVVEGKIEERMVEAISERGRSNGVALRLVVQNAEAGQVPGGMNVKTNLMGAAGNVIGLRPGTSSGATMTLSATSEEVDLRSLPEGGGWGAILTAGVVASDRARLEFIKGMEQIAPYVEGFAPRTLRGADLAAADGPGEDGDTLTGLYSGRFTGAAWLKQMEQARAGTPAPEAARLTVVNDRETVQVSTPATTPETGLDVAAQADKAAANLLSITAAKVEQGAQSRQDVVDALRNAGAGGTTRDELEAATGLSKATVNRHLKALVDAGQVRRNGDLVQLVDTDEVGA